MFKKVGGEVLYLRGNRALAARDFVAAREIFSRGVERAPDDAGFQLRLGAALAGLGETAAAERALARASDLEPGNAAVAVLWGLSLLDRARFDEALGLFDRALEQDAQQPLALAAKGLAWVRQGDLGQGLPLLERELAHTGEDFQAGFLCFCEETIHSRAGTAFLLRSLLIVASPEVEVGTGSGDDPGRDLPSLMKEGERLLESGRFEEASERFRRATKLRPSDEDALLSLAYAHLLDRRYSKVISLARKSGKESPDFFRLRGLAHLGLAELEQAADWLGRGAVGTVDHLDRHLLAVARLLAGEGSGARSHFVEALRLAPHDWITSRLGVLGGVLRS
jgi:Flp pilus assembly protein TadD